MGVVLELSTSPAVRKYFVLAGWEQGKENQ